MGNSDKNKKDILDIVDNLIEDESGISSGNENLHSDDLVNDLDEDVENRTERNIELPFKDEEEENDKPETSGDLVNDLDEDDEEQENELPEITKNPDESFTASKKLNKSKKTMQGVAAIAGAVILLIIMIVPAGKKEKKEDEAESRERIDTDEILREMKQYSGDDLRKKQERRNREAMPDTPIKSEIPEEKKDEKEGKKTNRSSRGNSGNPGTTGNSRFEGCHGANCQKDRDILDKYADINPELAAEGGTASRQGLLNVPARTGQGGLNIISSGAAVPKKASYFNLELRAVLKFGVRSSSGTNVVAIVKESKGKFPEGAIFYGTASFNNKRTFINFTHAIVNDEKIELEGNAMMGKDPGIPSEVSEIAADNANSSLKSGVLGAAGKVADNALSRVTGGATDGVLSSPTSDLQEKQEQQKKQYEYFVPAKTAFIIYVY
ncbi:MAG: hypothetical protein RBT69_10680 [Spirochaetia bacterium]|nr:hypothetical protein [Spirochaetia bacterium]